MLKVKDPAAIAPYGVDWTSYLAALGSTVTITTSTWTITGSDNTLTSANASIVTGGKQTQTFLSGGTLGVTYTVTNQIQTSSSPPVTDERSFEVLIENQ
jgi:hypothetical protein